MRRRIIPIGDQDPIGQRGRGPAIGIVIRVHDGLRALGDLREPVGSIIGVGDGRLPIHRHRSSAIRGIIGITDTALGGRFCGEAVQVVIGAGDGAGERVEGLESVVPSL